MIPIPSAQLIRAVHLEQEGTTTSGLNLKELAGRLIEFSGEHDSCCLTAACSLLLEAQHEQVPAVWVSATANSFYPPDMADNGVDLSALPIVRAPDITAAGKAADWLLRSGSFGLLFLDLGTAVYLPAALQGRLVQLAGRYDSALICLTQKTADQPSLGSLVSLRAGLIRQPGRGGDFSCHIRILKDKRRGPGRTLVEDYRAPVGLR